MEDGAERIKVITTASGLEYQILAEGSGPHPVPQDKVEVEVTYVGTLPDGTIFDQTQEDSTTVLPLESVIPGWQEGLQLMRTGSTFRFTIPPELAYGECGAGKIIPSNATLIFEIELRDIPNR